MIAYRAREESFKKPFGAVKAGETVQFWVQTGKQDPVQRVDLLVCPADRWNDVLRVPMQLCEVLPRCNRWSALFTPEEPALLFYRFAATQNGREISYFKAPDGSAVAEGENWWQLTVYRPDFAVPDFIKGGVYYQIFPDRFCRSGQEKTGVPNDRILHPEFNGLPEYLPDQNGKIANNDYYGGDLRGITEKLSYLKSLGVRCIYLNPIFLAHSNHRYNTADYCKIDPLLGTETDFKELCEKAHQNGMGVLLDGVFSHTGSDSIYFNKEGRYGDTGAFRDPKSPYRSWYHFRNYPSQYESWWGIETLPEVDETDPGFLEFICGEQGVLEYWMTLGADGFRLDVADELPDRFLDAVRQRLKKHPDKLLIGEVWEDASHKISYGQRRRYLLGDQLDSVMNYPFTWAILNFIRHGGSEPLYETVFAVLENYPAPAIQVLMNSLSTHDILRAITALGAPEYHEQDRQWQAEHHFLPFGEYAWGKTRLQLASLLQYFLPGVPCLYYGDEAGLSGYRDPFNRCPYPWGEEDPQLLQWFRLLGELREKNKDVLCDGAFLPVSLTHDVFAFLRKKEEHGLFVAVNRGEAAQEILLPGKGTVFLLGDLPGGFLQPGKGIVARVLL